MGRVRDAVRRLGVVGELFAFLWREKLWWMIPLLLALLAVGAVVLVSANPALAPFVYSLF